MKQRLVGAFVAAVGTIFAVYVGYIRPGVTPPNPALPFFFIVGPWFVLDALLVFFHRLRGLFISALLMLIYELVMYYAVFINPAASTAGVEYVLKPAVQLLVLLPLGLGIARIAGRTSA